MKLEEFCIHPKVVKRLFGFAEHPVGNLLIYGSKGVGKASLAQALASKICEREEFVSTIMPEKESISIEQVRSIKQNLKLKTLDAKNTRCIVIIDADTMTIEAQNAFLKLLEEPPMRTHIIMTTSAKRLLLATIVSRVNELYIPLPARQSLEDVLKKKRYEPSQIQNALKSSLGLPGLCTAILEGADTYYMDELELAKTYLQAPLAQKLKIVDKLAKNRTDAIRLVDALNVIAVATLETIPKSADKWVKATRLLLGTADELYANANTKLTLTKLSLELG